MLASTGRLQRWIGPGPQTALQMWRGAAPRLVREQSRCGWRAAKLADCDGRADDREQREGMDGDPEPIADEQEDQSVERVDETSENERPLRARRRADAEEDEERDDGDVGEPAE